MPPNGPQEQIVILGILTTTASFDVPRFGWGDSAIHDSPVSVVLETNMEAHFSCAQIRSTLLRS